MSTSWMKAALAIFALALVGSIMPGCRSAGEPESYLAVVPKVLHSGSTESVSVALFAGDRLATGDVEVSLLQAGREIARTAGTVKGKGTIDIAVPDVEEGQYQVRVKGSSFDDSASVTVEKSLLTFLETDKPIYKPGQTIHIKVVTLTGELTAAVGRVTVEVFDAKGIKLFRKEVDTDDFGMANLDLPVSTEPNEGVWKITATTEKGRTQLDVRVEKYVLPKYEVKVQLPREWFLANEAITGKVSSEYSFGKPVRGELEIRASRYVGEWEEYATFSGDIDGETDFELPPVRYVAGVPAAGGQGNVMLDITVTETGTGYQEKTNRLLSVAESPLTLQLIPEGLVFKPGLPFGFLVVTETPGNDPVDKEVRLAITYIDGEYQELKTEEKRVSTRKGKALVTVTPPKQAAAMIVEGRADDADATLTLEASYSPSGHFIHVEQMSEGTPAIGEEIRFKVNSTRRAANFYYEVVSRDRVVFTDYTGSSTIAFDATPLMTPSARLLVYQILPNSEVAADYIPFQVKPEYPHEVTAEFSREEAEPGAEVDIKIRTEGEARVGIAAVDRSVFILAENRLNLQQVFDELERLYMKPQVELHQVSIYPTITTRGARDTFDDAGVVVLSNNSIPEGKEYEARQSRGGIQFAGEVAVDKAAMAEREEAVPAPVVIGQPPEEGLAEVQRVRQFFPETWLWADLTTGADGRRTVTVTVPDSITTWMLRAIAVSREKGLGIAEDQLRAFQPFFLTIDLPYSAIRGEEFPVQVAIYNYLDEPQSVQVEIEEADWFELLDEPTRTVDIAANDIGGASFMVRPTQLGSSEVKVTARSRQAADAVIKTLLIEPEGVSREAVDNLTISADQSRLVSTAIPFDAVAGSGRAYLAITSSFLTQTIEGLEELIQMPFGCGEQNMIMLAPDIFITRYLQESGQVKPEVMAKAEKLMITGYQRQLTFRRNDGSFSAFGQSDQEGSLWLTAFVLKSFAQARDLIYIDDGVLSEASEWIRAHQNQDGSFDAVGFVHHQEMIGGLSGKDALTAYVAIALMEAGETASANRAVSYLESRLGQINDAYELALTAYALELAGSAKRDQVYQKLMAIAQEDEDGLHWGGGEGPVPLEEDEATLRRPGRPVRSTEIETTAYATLALVKRGDVFNASRAAKWLVSRRNAYGGYGSTQDTVVTLQALTEYSTGTRADVDLTITVTTDGKSRQLRLTQDNFDVLQVVEIPVNSEVTIGAAGRGEAVTQVVRRFNLPEAQKDEEILGIQVDYDVTEVEVNDLVTVSVELEFRPPVPMEAGMIVADVSVPTGFATVAETVAAAVEEEAKLKRYDIAGRKVIFYVENMLSGERLSWSFQVKARYPVRAKGVSSEVYSYYKPEICGETLGAEMVVSGD